MTIIACLILSVHVGFMVMRFLKGKKDIVLAMPLLKASDLDDLRPTLKMSTLKKEFFKNLLEVSILDIFIL